MGLTRLFIAIKDPTWSGVLPRSLDVVPAAAPPGWAVFTKGSVHEWVETVERELERQMSDVEVPFWCAWVEDSDYAYIFGGKGGIARRIATWSEDAPIHLGRPRLPVPGLVLRGGSTACGIGDLTLL
jgi:hypothetical protein